MKSLIKAVVIAGVAAGVALPAFAGIGVAIDLGDVAIGYQDGYYDSHHHWHHWAHPNDWQTYSHAHPQHFHNYNHDRDNGHR